MKANKQTNQKKKKTCIHSSPGLCGSLEDLSSASDMSLGYELTFDSYPA